MRNTETLERERERAITHVRCPIHRSAPDIVDCWLNASVRRSPAGCSGPTRRRRRRPCDVLDRRSCLMWGGARCRPADRRCRPTTRRWRRPGEVDDRRRRRRWERLAWWQTTPSPAALILHLQVLDTPTALSLHLYVVTFIQTRDILDIF